MQQIFIAWRNDCYIVFCYKLEEPMIETKKETQDAILEIQKITEWSLNQVARQADLNTSTVTRLVNGQSRPSMETRFKLDKLLKRMKRRAGIGEILLGQ